MDIFSYGNPVYASTDPWNTWNFSYGNTLSLEADECRDVLGKRLPQPEAKQDFQRLWAWLGTAEVIEPETGGVLQTVFTQTNAAIPVTCVRRVIKLLEAHEAEFVLADPELLAQLRRSLVEPE